MDEANHCLGSGRATDAGGRVYCALLFTAGSDLTAAPALLTALLVTAEEAARLATVGANAVFCRVKQLLCRRRFEIRAPR